MKRWGLLIAVLAGLALVVWWRGARPRVERRGEGAEVSGPAREAGELSSARPGSEGRRALESAPLAEPPPSAGPQRAPEAPGARLRVGGALLAARTRAPIAGAEVRLLGDAVEALATCDRSGRFAFELDPARWTLGATVGVEARLGRASVFHGQVALEPELTLLGRARYVLRGRLVTETAVGFGEDERAPLTLGVSVPAAFDGVGTYVGTTTLGLAKRFELEAWVEELPPAFQLVFASGASQLLSVEAPAAPLVSPEGATIRLPLVRLEVHVVDERAQPLAGADVRAKPLPLEREAAVLHGTTDDSGLLRFHVPPGEVELAVGLAGHAVYVAVLELPAGSGRSERVVLHPFGTAERVAGRVVDERDAPVAGAWVSACPRTLEGELSVVAAAGQRSDDEGRFDFAAGANAALQVLAYRKDMGFSEPLVVEGGARELVLVIAPQGTLRVVLEGLPAGESPSAGFAWLLADAEGEVLESGRDWGRELELEPVACGPHEVFVRALGTGYFGSALASVAPGENELIVALRPLARVHGTLLERDGRPAAGLALTLEGSGLPPAAAAHFAHGRTGGLGDFDLLLGEATAGVLRVEREGAEPARFPVAAGEAGVLRLP
jgi:hypothetical protein